MAIAPGGLDGVGADRFQPLKLEIGRQRLSPENPFAGPLVAAARTRAFGTQEQVGEAVNPSVGPGDFQDLFGLQGSNVAGRIDHSRVPAGGFVAEYGYMNLESNRDDGELERPASGSRRFYVRAASVNAVRRALYRAPGGARVVGRFDRETIECQHTMDAHSYRRHWPVIASRLEKAGLVVVVHHEHQADEKPIEPDSPRESSWQEFDDVEH